MSDSPRDRAIAELTTLLETTVTQGRVNAHAVVATIDAILAAAQDHTDTEHARRVREVIKSVGIDVDG